MQLSVLFVILGFTVLTQGYQDSPKGLHFVGVGYNLLEGNPEGGDVSNGGVDPGLLFTRKIFKLTWKTNKVSVDKKYIVPDQVSFAPRESCVTTNKKEVFSGTKSYQEKLNLDVESSGGYDAALWNVAFSMSTRFEQMKKETEKYHNVFYEEKNVCNRGRARYQLDLAPIKKFSVSEDFAAAVCVLPENYNEKAYFQFIERWGTHIVVEVDLGEKKYERSKSTNAEFTKYAMNNLESSVSVSGGFKGFKASLKVDMKKFRESMSEKTEFGEDKVKFSSGGPDMPEPIGLKLVPIYEAFDVNFYTAMDHQQSTRCVHSRSLVGSRKVHVKKALKEYPRLKKAVKPFDPEVRIPLTWPVGTYGLPMPKAGCPKGVTFSWHVGTRYQDTEDSRGKNSWSNPYDLAGSLGRSHMEQKFCMKTIVGDKENGISWPRGQYCILKKGNCPEGFRAGYIRWDDENIRNRNGYSGQLPDGHYDKNTHIGYCCRADGHATNAIILPTDTPFVMLKSNTHLCQQVKGMRVRSEHFYWDTEDWFPKNYGGGFKPYASIGKNVRLDYCYYYH
ncbi:uncharacterized protein LOC144665526 [Oculina patagonica]